MINDNKEIEGMKKNVTAAIKHDADHPILLSNNGSVISGEATKDFGVGDRRNAIVILDEFVTKVPDKYPIVPPNNKIIIP